MLEVYRQPILSYDENKKPVRTKKPCQIMTLTAELCPKGRVAVYFSLAGPYEFWDNGKATTDSMRDWVLPPHSVVKVAQERIAEKQRERQAARARLKAG